MCISHRLTDVFFCTVNFGYNDIGYNDISLITTLISCPELFSIYRHTKSFGYNDILNNDTSQITTHISRPKALNHCEYNDKHSTLTVLASPSKKSHGTSVDRCQEGMWQSMRLWKTCQRSAPAYSTATCAQVYDIVYVHKGMVHVRHVTHVKHTQYSASRHTCIHNAIICVLRI